jgi:hypothetical protein
MILIVEGQDQTMRFESKEMIEDQLEERKDLKQGIKWIDQTSVLQMVSLDSSSEIADFTLVFEWLEEW